MSIAERRAAFRKLHESGCFVIPNPSSIGEAKRLAKLGFKAIASSSAGAAWILGKEDGELTRDEVLSHLRELVAATDLPVNADFENGFADSPADVATNVALAIDTGVAGLSIEDWSGRDIYDLRLATARISAARAAIDRSGTGTMLVGRAEGVLRGVESLGDVIARLRAYADAGADCLFAPGVRDLGQIRKLVSAVAPNPMNIIISRPGLSVADVAAAGVRRVSTGGALADAAWRGFDAAARSLAEHGVMPPVA